MKATPNTQQRNGGNNNDRNALIGAKQDNRKKYCRFKKNGIKYVDYKDPNFLLKFVNEQGRVLPRRLT